MPPCHVTLAAQAGLQHPAPILRRAAHCVHPPGNRCLTPHLDRPGLWPLTHRAPESQIPSPRLPWPWVRVPASALGITLPLCPSCEPTPVPRRPASGRGGSQGVEDSGELGQPGHSQGPGPPPASQPRLSCCTPLRVPRRLERSAWPFKRSCPDQQKAGCGLGPCLGQSRLTGHPSLLPPPSPQLASGMRT